MHRDNASRPDMRFLHHLPSVGPDEGDRLAELTVQAPTKRKLRYRLSRGPCRSKLPRDRFSPMTPS
jgi:hypothetical protein